MEKYGVQEDDMIAGLRNEEHSLMLEVAQYMNGNEKTADEENRYQQVQNRLSIVRNAITEHDLKKLR